MTAGIQRMVNLKLNNMDILTLQRDIQGLQSQCISIRWEKDDEARKEKLAKLYNTLVELAHEVKEI